MSFSLADLQLIYGTAGAREQFERMCSLLIKNEFPSANSIRVFQGDGGVDTSVGDWVEDLGVTVFQQKYFNERIGESQKSQIRKSYKAALVNPLFTLQQWVLCLPINLSGSEKKWFDEWRLKQSKPIELWDQLKLEHLLLEDRNRGIKELFFKQEHLSQIREIHRVVTERAESDVPHVELGILQGSDLSTRVVWQVNVSKIVVPSDVEISEEIERERQQLADIIENAERRAEQIKITQRTSRPPFDRPGLERSYGFDLMWFGPHFIEAFRRRWADYLTDLEIERKKQRSYRSGTRLDLTFGVLNPTKSEVLSLEGSFLLPEETVITWQNTLDRLPDFDKYFIPKPPKPQWEDPSWFDTHYNTGFAKNTTEANWWFGDKGRRLLFRIPSLLAGERWLLSFVVFVTPKHSEGFPIEYTAHAKNLTKRESGMINVIFQNDGDDDKVQQGN